MSPVRRTALPFEVFALVAGGFTVALGYGVVAPVIAQFALEFGVSLFQASAIVSVFALMRLAGAPVAAWVIARCGERFSYTVGILIVALSTGGAAFAANYSQFLVLRGAGGIGSAMFTVAATALLIKVSPGDARGRVASLNAAGFLLGGLLGPVLGGIVAGFGIRAPFIFYFFTLIIAAFVVTVALRHSRAATPGGVSEVPDETLTLVGALRVPQYRTLLLSVFGFGWTAFGVRVSVIPLFVVVSLDSPGGHAAWVLAAYAAGNALLVLPSGRWNDHVGRKLLLVTGMGVLTVSYAVFPLSSSLGVAIAVMFFAGAGSALVNPAHQAVLADIVAHRTGGRVVAAYSMVSDLGGMFGPLIAGAIIDVAGFGWAFWVSAALVGVATLAWVGVADSRRLVDHSL